MSLEIGPRHFDFVHGAFATTHTINHNLNDTNVTISVYDLGTATAVIPSEITITNANTVTMTFFIAVRIRGRVTKEQ